jgi:hypothetical protein
VQLEAVLLLLFSSYSQQCSLPVYLKPNSTENAAGSTLQRSRAASAAAAGLLPCGLVC